MQKLKHTKSQRNIVYKGGIKDQCHKMCVNTKIQQNLK